MTGPQAAILSGNRLHLQHGPIDLVIGADGDRETAFAAAQNRFATILEELVTELPMLRAPVSASPQGAVARRMFNACRPHGAQVFVTPMAAVAGSVADEVLSAMVADASLSRAYVNNGGDIAVHLRGAETFRVAMAGLSGAGLGHIDLSNHSPSRGIATSGRGGRSLSLGIADSVTVLARDAAAADVAATLIANAVDLPDHPAITREPAENLQPDSDLRQRLVVTQLGSLTRTEIAQALSNGAACAQDMLTEGLIDAAALTLCGQTRVIGQSLQSPAPPRSNTQERIALHA